MKVFRHKQSDSFMCLSFLLTFVVAVIAMGYLNDAFSREISEQEHSYQNSVTVYVSNEQGFDDAFLEYLEQRDIQGIMMISEFTVSVDKADVEYTANIVVAGNEGIKYYNKEYHSINLLQTGGVVIGKNIASFTQNDEISLDDTLFRVTGVEKDNGEEFYENVVYIPISHISEYMKNKILSEETVTIIMASDKADVYNQWSKIDKELKEQYKTISTQIQRSSGDLQQEEQDGREGYYVLLYLFCLMNCIAAADFWISERYREIAIRKAFGYHTGQLFWCLYKEFVKIAAFSMLGCIVVTLLFKLVVHRTVRLLTEQSIFNIVFVVGTVVLTSLISIIIPIITNSANGSLNDIIKRE